MGGYRSMYAMEQNQHADAKQRRIIHPFLFAIFPVLSVFSTHVDHVSINEVYLPLTVMLFACGASWLFLRFIIPQRHKRGLAMSLFLFVFWAYGPVIDQARVVIGHRVVVGNLVLGVGVLSVALAVVAGLYVLRRSTYTFEKATSFLNKASACAVLAALGTLCFKASHVGLPASHGESSLPGGPQSQTAAQEPDVYYIILDAYAREDILRDLFHYDNGPFLSFLKDRGFYVANKSYSNYPWTLFSLSSSLNMDYLSAGASEAESQREFDLRVQNQFRSNRVVALLKERGYECVSFTSGYSATDGMDVDVTLKPGLLLGEFENVLINMTPLRTLLGRTEYLSQYTMHRKRVIYALDWLPKVRRGRKPLFVFAHVTIPHPPFVLDAAGKAIESDRPFILPDGPQFFESGGTAAEYVSGYTGQVTYVNKRMMQIIDQIIAGAPNAVILVQGDHGSRLKLTPNLETTDLREAFGILNAYRLPGRDAQSLLHESISPVNSFRVVFNAYFAAGRPLLEDRSYSGEGGDGFHLVEVTERLK